MNVALRLPAGKQTKRQTLHHAAVARVVDTMRRNLFDPLPLEDMADIACFSPFHFNRLFKETTGIPPSQFLYALRLDQAKRLLITTDQSVTDICFEVGYNSLGSFINRFTELVGLSPNSFRRFAREFDGFTLAAVRNMLAQAPELAPDHSGPAGRLILPADFEGLIFVGLFRRAIPERQPVACLLKTIGQGFRFPAVPAGAYYVFSVALPWTAGARDLLMLDDAFRGRSTRLTVSPRQAPAGVDIWLRAVDDLHPPILAALPVLVTRKLAGLGGTMPPECAAAMGESRLAGNA